MDRKVTPEHSFLWILCIDDNSKLILTLISSLPTQSLNFRLRSELILWGLFLASQLTLSRRFKTRRKSKGPKFSGSLFAPSMVTQHRSALGGAQGWRLLTDVWRSMWTFRQSFFFSSVEYFKVNARWNLQEKPPQSFSFYRCFNVVLVAPLRAHLGVGRRWSEQYPECHCVQDEK